MSTVEDLRKKVKELEAQLAAAQGNVGPVRQKIDVMSSEVVDSNPYRYFMIFLYEITKSLKISWFFNMILSLFNKSSKGIVRNCVKQRENQGNMLLLIS